MSSWVTQTHSQVSVDNTNMGRDSSVGIATRYVLDSPGIENR
jgi:hypothetical protein